MENMYKTPKMLAGEESDLCPGCMQGIAIRIIYELIEEVEIENFQILPLGVDCPEYAMGWGGITFQKPAYGAGSMSAGMKRINPDKIIIIYQGDGSANSAGISDTVHTANRGDSVTVISINNTCAEAQKPSFSAPNFSAFSGGFQNMQPPNLNAFSAMASPGMKTAEIIAALPNPAFVARVSVHNPKEIIKAKNTIKKGLEKQIDNAGYSFIEILCPCHKSLDIDIEQIPHYMESNAVKEYPLGVLKSK
ncbi:MAG: hypothetical protein GYA50_08485 [Eubacteriaceae bacterium]|nr:hypothetical protein [Eubacteriaceae bacterium]